jgi:hypothetical protein
MNTFWSSLGTLDSLMMDAGSLPCEGTCGLMMGIEVWVAIGTGDARSDRSICCPYGDGAIWSFEVTSVAYLNYVLY